MAAAAANSSHEPRMSMIPACTVTPRKSRSSKARQAACQAWPERSMGSIALRVAG